MAPSKPSRNGHDDTKAEVPGSKDKNGHAAAHHSNGKMRRVASSAGSNLREVTSASAVPGPVSATTTVTAHEASIQGLQWPAFEREVLHAYRRAYHINTPSSFTKEYHHWVLTQAGSVGLHSPTIARRKEFRRQTTDQLATVVRKHFNGLGVQENDIIVDFLHKVRTPGVSKNKSRKTEYIPPDSDR